MLYLRPLLFSRYDNSNKLLVKASDGSANKGAMLEGGNTLTLEAPPAPKELTVGDALRLGQIERPFLVAKGTSQ